MRKIFIVILGIISGTLLAQTPVSEEALILNQELQYLEDSVNNIQSISLNAKEPAARQRALNEKSLEKTYFGNDMEEDVINTRTASPKRRGL